MSINTLNSIHITSDALLIESTEVLKNSTIRSKNTVSQSIQKTLDDLFPEQAREEKTLKRTKEILGALVDTYSQEQLQDIVAEVQYLVCMWLDDFERNIFSGLTLQELLHEKGTK